jgi:histidinol dehydrogenase
MLIADESARPRWLAADLLAQAEHGSGRERVYFLYHDKEQPASVRKEVKQILPGLRHRDAVARIWRERTLAIHCPDLKAAAEVANFVAPEHLELHVGKAVANDLTRRIRTAGAILRGHETATVLGDFTAGPSHTLPTGRTGRFFSGLKITDFMRRSSIVEYDERSLARARDVVATFAELEDLDAHGLSMEVRFPDGE